jgi:hypothetical protein
MFFALGLIFLFFFFFKSKLQNTDEKMSLMNADNRHRVIYVGTHALHLTEGGDRRELRNRDINKNLIWGGALRSCRWSGG